MKQLTATMAGTVFNILISQGDEVQSGQQVIILESMKMEIPLESNFSGKVIELKVNIGDFVNEGDVLAVIE